MGLFSNNLLAVHSSLTTALTTLICLLWVILLSCILFIRWDVSSQTERKQLLVLLKVSLFHGRAGHFLLLFLGIDALTTIMLPILYVPLFVFKLPAMV